MSRYWKQLPLRHRLLIVALLPTLLIVTLVSSIFIIRSTRDADEAMKERAFAVANFLAPAAEYGVMSGNPSALSALLQAVMNQRDIAAAYILNQQGLFLQSRGNAQFAQIEQIQAVKRTQLLKQSGARLTVTSPVWLAPLIIDDVTDRFDERGVASLENSAKPIGWIYLEFDTRNLQLQKRKITLITLLGSLLGLIVTAMLALRFANSVARPIGYLAEAVENITDNNLDISVPESAGSYEIQALEKGFNLMVGSIRESRDTLEARIVEATAQLAHQAHHDPLTGLPNRRVYEQTLEEVIRLSLEDEGAYAALCFIDLDRFKIVNDTAGHAAGDALLRNIAHIIAEQVRSEDQICRIGGDEFALILCGCPLSEAYIIAEQLQKAIANYVFEWDGQKFSVGASIGLVMVDGTIHTVNDLTVAADLACYSAKRGGRGQVVVHHHSDKHWELNDYIPTTDKG